MITAKIKFIAKWFLERMAVLFIDGLCYENNIYTPVRFDELVKSPKIGNFRTSHLIISSSYKLDFSNF